MVVVGHIRSRKSYQSNQCHSTQKSSQEKNGCRWYGRKCWKWWRFWTSTEETCCTEKEEGQDWGTFYRYRSWRCLSECWSGCIPCNSYYLGSRAFATCHKSLWRELGFSIRLTWFRHSFMMAICRSFPNLHYSLDDHLHGFLLLHMGWWDRTISASCILSEFPLNL